VSEGGAPQRPSFAGRWDVTEAMWVVEWVAA
jgi:hypothetical protein